MPAAVNPTDDPNEYIVVPDVPLLDEHVLLDGDQGPVRIDAAKLARIAANNNSRVERTGDETPVVIGHTRDDAPETDQPPVVGYATNFRTGPFAGGTALYADLKILKSREDEVRKYPRRSVELWLKRLEVDPVSLLGATTPERDLGLLRFSKRGRDGVHRIVACSAPKALAAAEVAAATYAAGESPVADTKELPPEKPKADDAAPKPDDATAKMVAQVQNSEWGQHLSQMVEEMYEMMMAQQGGGNPQDMFGPEDAGAGGPPPGGPPPGGPPGGPAPSAPPPEKDERKFHEGNPTQYGHPTSCAQYDASAPSATNVGMPMGRRTYARTEAPVATPIATTELDALKRELATERKAREDLAKKYERERADAHAERIVQDLQRDGYEIDAAEEKKLIAALPESYREHHAERVRKYHRKAPVTPVRIDLAADAAGTQPTQEQYNLALAMASAKSIPYETALEQVRSGRR